MNAKVYQDGKRLIVSFEDLENAEEFLQRVVDIVSGPVPLTPEMVSDLDPIVTEADSVVDVSEEVKEPCCLDTSNSVQDFSEPFAGNTPTQILSAPNFEGFYFLCRAVRFGEVPAVYKEEVAKLLIGFMDQYKILQPPYGNVERMKRYCQMAQKMLGNHAVPDDAFTSDDAEWLDGSCQTVYEFLESFYSQRLHRMLQQ